MRCMEAEMSSALTAGREGSGEELFCILTLVALLLRFLLLLIKIMIIIIIIALKHDSHTLEPLLGTSILQERLLESPEGAMQLLQELLNPDTSAVGELLTSQLIYVPCGTCTATLKFPISIRYMVVIILGNTGSWLSHGCHLTHATCPNTAANKVNSLLASPVAGHCALPQHSAVQK